jgi:uncharacterized protein
MQRGVEVVINEASFKAELASNEKQRMLGLGKRKSLCLDCGMLFVFPEASQRGFWMKNMKFDLDIIWINENKIVYIEKNFSKDSSITVKPDVKADKVLEVNAGTSDANGFSIGDKVFVQ